MFSFVTISFGKMVDINVSIDATVKYSADYPSPEMLDKRLPRGICAQSVHSAQNVTV